MLIKILLIVAIVIQTIATLFAIRLIRTTKYNSIWILFTIGFTLLSVERVVQFLRANGQTLPYEVFVWLGLVISISMSIGVMYAHKLFKYIARLNRQRQLLNKQPSIVIRIVFGLRCMIHWVAKVISTSLVPIPKAYRNNDLLLVTI